MINLLYLHIILLSSNLCTLIYSLVFFTFYGYVTNSQSGQLPVGLIAQLVDFCTGVAEVMGSTPVEAWIFFIRLWVHNCLKCVHNCDDQYYIFIILQLVLFKHTQDIRRMYSAQCIRLLENVINNNFWLYVCWIAMKCDKYMYLSAISSFKS